MKRRFAIQTIVAFFMMVGRTTVAIAEDLPRRTALDDYIQKPDDSYSWKIDSTRNADGVKTIIVDMVSQNWRTKQDVDRTEWRHWLTVSIPEQATSDIGMLFIGGGYNGEGARANKRTEAIDDLPYASDDEHLLVRDLDAEFILHLVDQVETRQRVDAQRLEGAILGNSVGGQKKAFRDDGDHTVGDGVSHEALRLVGFNFAGGYAPTRSSREVKTRSLSKNSSAIPRAARE